MRRGFRGWQVEYKDGSTIDESQASWHTIPKDNIKTLTLFYDGRSWHLDNKGEYYQKKRASCVPGIPESLRIESRSIGYYEGKSIILYTVNEHTGRMRLEVKDISG